MEKVVVNKIILHVEKRGLRTREYYRIENDITFHLIYNTFKSHDN